MSESTWTQAEAIEIATAVEAIAPEYGCHVALTGGCLYRRGVRKDCDLVIYRIRQVPQIDVQGFLSALAAIGFSVTSDHGFCVKCDCKGRGVDLLFPEWSTGGYYEEQEEIEWP
jgi:hypothetical protein